MSNQFPEAAEYAGGLRFFLPAYFNERWNYMF